MGRGQRGDALEAKVAGSTECPLQALELLRDAGDRGRRLQRGVPWSLRHLCGHTAHQRGLSRTPAFSSRSGLQASPRAERQCSWSRRTQSLASPVTLGESLPLSEPVFVTCKMGTRIGLTHEVERTEMLDTNTHTVCLQETKTESLIKLNTRLPYALDVPPLTEGKMCPPKAGICGFAAACSSQHLQGPSPNSGDIDDLQTQVQSERSQTRKTARYDFFSGTF